MIPFFLGVCEFLLHEFPEVEFSLLFSSFLGENILEEIAGAELYRAMKVPAVRVMLTAEGLALISEGGVRANVLQEGHRKAMYSADLALTIPGTNTMELACTGTPMVVVLPLHRPEMIPLDGLAGLVGSIPIVGRMIKSVGVNRYLKRWRYCALPNMRAGRELVPEVKGNIAPEDVARVAISLLKDRKRRAVISTDLREVTGENGATDRFACCCLELL